MISPLAAPTAAKKPERGPPFSPEARQNNMSGPGVSISTVTATR
jgi:hypothetical protein